MDKPPHIPFMNNYCDRWCERCPMTDRCAAFKPKWVSEEWKAQSEGEFLKEFQNNLKETMSALQEMVEKEGMDWEQLVEDASDYEIPEPALSDLEKEVLELANNYCTKTMEWLDSRRPVIENFVQELQQQFEIGIGTPETSVSKVIDALEIIDWYCTLINTKTHRAVEGAHDEFNDADEDPTQNDANGTAKLVVICIHKSINAWEAVREEISELEDESLDYLALLSKIRTGLTAIFPNHEAFVRPGFDVEEVVG